MITWGISKFTVTSYQPQQVGLHNFAVVVSISYRAYHVRFPRKYPFPNQFLRILNHSILLNGRIDLLLVEDLIAANYNCNPIKGPKLDYQLVNSATKKGPEIADFRASLTGRLHVLVDAR